MEEIFGIVESIVFSAEENGFIVARIKEPKKRELSLIVGVMPELRIGETITCKGRWKLNSKFGMQFEVSSFQTQIPTDLVGIQRYLESGLIKGIGPAYAKRIVERFGVDTLTILDTAPAKLLSVGGIGEKRIETIIRCWDEQRKIRTVMIFLRGHDVPPSLAQKIFKTYGDQSIEKLEENPYQIAKEVRGIGFKTADRIAQNLGISKDAPHRIESGIEHTLWELSNEGHVCYPKQDLVNCCGQLLEIEGHKVELGLVSSIEKQFLVERDGLIWIKALFLSEMGIAKELERIRSSPCVLRGVDVEKALIWVQEKLHIELAKQQAEGVASALQEKILILTGGPGTGKSTITSAILSILEKVTTKVLLAAPTGRAAKRLSEITWRKASTIHSLLEMDFSNGGFKRGRDNPLACELLIVDESSMIDTHLMYALLKAIPSTTRLIFVGDIDQLPSVGPGNVLRDIIESNAYTVIRLTEIFRQAKGSHIVVNAHRINKGEFPYLNGEKDFIFIEKETPEEIESSLVDLIAHHLPQFDPFQQIQVLCPMKRGVIGTENLNAKIQQLLNPSSNSLLRMGRSFRKRDKVMQLRNNYDKEVFNGDIGLIVNIDLTDQEIRVDFYGKEVCYDFTELDELILAYAVSIHKYQGSECPCIVIPIHTTHFKLLYRNLLYTGITRGKKKVILIGSKKAIAIAVHTEEVQKRYTGLKRQVEALSGSSLPPPLHRSVAPRSPAPL